MYVCVYIYIYENNFAVHQKLTQHHKSTILQFKKKKKKKSSQVPHLSYPIYSVIHPWLPTACTIKSQLLGMASKASHDPKSLPSQSPLSLLSDFTEHISPLEPFCSPCFGLLLCPAHACWECPYLTGNLLFTVQHLAQDPPPLCSLPRYVTQGS